jgi:membrane-bound serine protease (ClpP class)
MQVHLLPPDWRTRFLSIITDPSVAYILLLMGIYGLFFEFANPGFVLPGVAGAIALLLALYAFQLLPINYAGMALLFLGLAFLAAEAFMPTFGILGVGGIIAFIVGSIMLLDTGDLFFSISGWLILAMAVLNAVFFIGVIGLAIRAQRRPLVAGRETLLDLQGVVLSDFDHEGFIRIRGEIWRAQSDVPLKEGQVVRVTKIEGLLLSVKAVGEK